MRIFISHIKEEENLAFVFKEWIESTFLNQISVFVSSAPENIPAGDKWRETITSALNESKLLIILYSPLSKTRPWINFEAGCGWIKEIPIIPICHSGLKLEQIGEPISSFQGIAINDKDFTNKLFGSIAKHAGFKKHPKIDKNQFLTDIKESLKTFDSTIVPVEKDQKIKPKRGTLSEPDILALLTSHLNSGDIDLNMGAIKYSDIDDKLGIPDGSTKRYIKQIVQRWNYYPVNEGDEYIIFEHGQQDRSDWLDSRY